MSNDILNDSVKAHITVTSNNVSNTTKSASTKLSDDTLNDNSQVEVIVLGKSDKTLTKNIDAKDDSLRKRTSLIIVPQKDSPDDDYPGIITHNMSSSTIDNENCNELISDDNKTMEKSSSKSLESSICSNHSSTDEEDLNERNSNKNQVKNNKRNSLASVDSCVTRSNSSATTVSTSSTSTSSKSSSSGDDAILDDDYQDLENGNIIDDLEAERKDCISNASSCIDDYSLRQKYENYVNQKTQDAINNGGNSTDADEGNIEDADEDDEEVENAKENGMVKREHNEFEDDEVDTAQQPRSLPLCCDALLSPQEAPMGRRYAEVAQFKGNKR